MQTCTKFLITLIGLATLLGCAQNQKNQSSSTAQPSNVIELLAGTYTGDGSQGIYTLDFDAQKGSLSEPRLLVKANNPSYLTISKDRKYVFSVNSGDAKKISSFRWNEDKSQLILINQQPCEGGSPCYIDLNSEENALAVANYLTGNFGVYTIGEKGFINPTPSLIEHKGSGPVKPNQEVARAHCAEFVGKYLYIVDLGIDQVVTYSISETGNVEHAVSHVSLEPGDGPRHIVFNTEKNLAFVVNELSSTVVSFQVDPEKGELKRIDRVSILPDDFDGENSSADIHLSANGKFLYASNRGHNSIAIIAVGEQGQLELKGIESVKGETPRNFTLSPDNRFLLAANQGSNNITVFSVNPQTGLLTFTGQKVPISRPTVLKF